MAERWIDRPARPARQPRAALARNRDTQPGPVDGGGAADPRRQASRPAGEMAQTGPLARTDSPPDETATAPLGPDPGLNGSRRTATKAPNQPAKQPRPGSANTGVAPKPNHPAQTKRAKPGQAARAEPGQATRAEPGEAEPVQTKRAKPGEARRGKPGEAERGQAARAKPVQTRRAEPVQTKRAKPLEGTPSTRTGKPARWRPQRRPLGEREPLFGRRLAVVYDVTGPRVRLGILWFAAAVASIRLGRFAGAVVFGAVAAVAALQTLRAWRYKRRGGHNLVAGCVAFALPVAAAIGTGFLGLVVVGCVGAAVVAALYEGRSRDSALNAAAHTIRCSLPVGLAAASMVLAVRLDISVALLLVLLVSAYEAGDFLIGSGADNSWEGPAAGIAAVLAVSLCTAVLSVPPFHGPDTWPFAALVAVGCPLGQIMGSAILPDAGAKAPALRRLDSLLLLGPAWVWLVGLYIGRVGA